MKRPFFTISLVLLLSSLFGPNPSLAPPCHAGSQPTPAVPASSEEKMPAPDQPTVITYDSESGERFTTAFHPHDQTVLLTAPGLRRRLPQVPAASGAKYSDGHVTFWSKGPEALVEVEGKILYRGRRSNGP